MGNLRQLKALCQGGRLDDARALYTESFQACKWSFAVLHSMAVAFARGGVPGAALIMLERAVELEPGNAAAHCNRGTLLQKLEQFEAAIASYETAIALKPDYALAHTNRGHALHQLKRPAAALASYDAALAFSPDLAAAYLGRGNVLLELRRWEAALSSYDQVLAINAASAEGHANRGVALTALGLLHESAASFDAAIALRPDYAEAYVGRGAVFRLLNQLEAAFSNYQCALQIRGEYAEAHFGRAIVWLLRGQLPEGWRDFEWRSQLPRRAGEVARNQYRQPLWLGDESIAGKSILIHAERGLGDTLQFCRYAQLLSDLDARVLLQVQAPLVNLLGTLQGASRVAAAKESLPEFDVHCPLLSLPLAFKTTLDNIPAARRFLQADPSRVARWRERLGERQRARVGIVWRGDPTNLDDRNRSIKLDLLLQHLPEGVQYFSLQKQLQDSEKAAFHVDGSFWSSASAMDFDETAALCECLDLIISVDTSIAHLSAALGRKTWILLPFSPDCRWLLDRDDSPWYPTVTLYRQSLMGDWPGVLARVAAQLVQEFRTIVEPTAVDV